MATPAPSVRAGAGLRLLRAAVFTAVCVVLAAAGHTAASGGTVPLWALAVGWLTVFAVVAPMAGRERTLPGIAGLLAAGQLALHTVFNAGQMCARAPAGHTGGSGSGLMAVAARLVCDSRGTRLTPETARQIVTEAGLDPSRMGMSMGAAAGAHPSGTAHTAMALPLCSLPMLLGHLFAAIVAGWLLRRGEAALWRLIRLSVRGAASLTGLTPALLRRVRALLSALAGAAAYALPRVRLAAGETGTRHRTVWLLRHSLARRGPPAVVLAA